MTIRPARAEWLHAYELTVRQTDRQTGMTKQIVTFRNFANASKNTAVCPRILLVNCVFMYLANSDHFLTAALNNRVL